MKDLLFGAADNYTWKQIKPWAQSIRDSGFDGDVTLLVYRGDAEDIAAAGSLLDINVFTAHTDMWAKPINHHAQFRDTQSHQMRFWHLVEWLNDTEIEQYRYIICTDVRDVIFQKNPSEFLRKRMLDFRFSTGILAPSEGIRYCNEPWGADNLQKGFGPYMWERAQNYEIFNVGTIAGSARAIRDLAFTLYTMGEQRFIPNDQSGFNLLVNGYLLNVDRVGHDEGWACQCGTMADPEKIEAFRPHLLSPEPVFDDQGYAFTSDGQMFCLLHQWDRVPSITGKIETRYGI